MATKLLYYVAQNGKNYFEEWLDNQSASVTAIVLDHLDKVERGLFGDFKSVGSGVYEFRIHKGAGYRVYYGYIMNNAVLILSGSDKSGQAKEIKHAKKLWREYKEKG